MVAMHHLELWTQDLARTGPAFDWLFTSLGYVERDTAGWDEARVWDAPDGTYFVLEQSPAITGALDRMNAGMNHFALCVENKEALDGLRSAATRNGFTELFAADYPHAGGPNHVALYLETVEGFEVELVVAAL